MLIDYLVKRAPSNFHKKGQKELFCPFHISLFFSSGQLTSIHLDSSKPPTISFHGDFYGNNKEKEAVERWFYDFFEGDPSPFPLPLRLNLPPFSMRVLEELQRIPFGQTVSYGELAEAAGNRGAARAVGNVCNGNPFPIVIPCHRVIRASGASGGFAYGSSMKEALLHFEKTVTSGQSLV